MIGIDGHELRFCALSSRTRRTLARKGFSTLEQIADRSEGELIEVYGLNDTILSELYGPMNGAGLGYRSEMP